MTDNTIFEKGSDILNKLRIIFFVLISGPLLFFFIVYLMIQNGAITPYFDLSEPAMHFGVIGVCLSMMVIGYLFYAIQRRKIRKQAYLQQKLQGLFRISIVKYAIHEGACLLSVIAFFLSGEVAMQALYLILLILMGLGNPTVFSIMNDLKLNKKEANIIRKNLPIDFESY